MAMGLWVAWLLSRVEARRKGLDVEFLDALAFAAIVGGVVGARLYYALFADLGGYLQDPGSIFRIWEEKRGDIAAAQTVAFDVTLPRPGRCVFYCDKFLHRRPFGMAGAFVAR